MRSLRYYEEQGLLQPVRTRSGQRLYGDDAVDRVGLIRRLFAAGLHSSTMADLLPCILEPTSRTPALAERLLLERARLETAIAGLEAARTELDTVIASADHPSSSDAPSAEPLEGANQRAT